MMALFSAPSQFFRSAAENALPYLTSEMIIVNVAKGIEQKTLRRGMSEIADEVFSAEIPHYKYAVLSGPSHDRGGWTRDADDRRWSLQNVRKRHSGCRTSL